MLEKFIDNDVMGFERVLRDLEKILLLIGTSKVCTNKIIPKIVKKNVLSYKNSEESFIRSTALLYKGGILKKVKYQEMRKETVPLDSNV